MAPFWVVGRLGPEELEYVARLAKVPVWLAIGLGPAWVCSGLGYAGDERDGARATVTVLSGPSPLGGAADLLLLAEEPGIGLGARLAGLRDLDPGERISAGPPHSKVSAARHPTALWQVEARPGDVAEPALDDAAVFVGEAKGLWLWLVVWPAAAGVVVYDRIELVDHRDAAGDGGWEFGTASARLTS